MIRVDADGSVAVERDFQKTYGCRTAAARSSSVSEVRHVDHRRGISGQIDHRVRNPLGVKRPGGLCALHAVIVFVSSCVASKPTVTTETRRSGNFAEFILFGLVSKARRSCNGSYPPALIGSGLVRRFRSTPYRISIPKIRTIPAKDTPTSGVMHATAPINSRIRSI